MLYLVRLEKPYVCSANARKEGKLNVQSGDLVISHGTVSGRFAPETFVPNMQNARHLMFSSNNS